MAESQRRAEEGKERERKSLLTSLFLFLFGFLVEVGKNKILLLTTTKNWKKKPVKLAMVLLTSLDKTKIK